jgi:hypothetical protein
MAIALLVNLAMVALAAEVVAPSHDTWWRSLWSDPVAGFTAVLAAFTLALVAVGAWQGVQLRRTVSAMAAEFVATHRPRIILRDAHALKLTDNEWIEVNYTLANVGETPATIVVSAFDLRLITTPMPGFEVDVGPFIKDGRNEIGEVVRLDAGESADLRYVSRALRWNADNRDLYHAFDEPSLGLMFYGHIVYEDESPRRVRRNTSFRRKYQHGDSRFYPSAEPGPLEYAD